jgi:hypothetical protein
MQRLLRKAERKNRLYDFGDMEFLKPFEVLIDSINREASLSLFGRFVTNQRLLGTLGNKLRAQWLFSHYPEIHNISLEPPVVITGLQRSGTTLLHRLLATDYRFRALSSWEAINPAPLLSRSIEYKHIAENEMRERIRKAKQAEKALSYIAPDFFAIHPIESLSPEEDVILLDFSFLSTVPESTLRVPTYSHWLEKQNHLPAYRYMEDMLKLLMWQRSANRWILKSPHHLEFLDALFQVFPNVSVIQTHRDPAVAVPSFCSMISHGRGLLSEKVNPKEVGAHWSRKVQRMITKAMWFRETVAEERFHDVYYQDLITDPLGEIRKIYDYIGIELTTEVYRRMQHALTENRQYRYGIHRYSPHSFGLTKEQLRDAFHEYCVRFDIQEERP